MEECRSGRLGVASNCDWCLQCLGIVVGLAVHDIAIDSHGQPWYAVNL